MRGRAIWIIVFMAAEVVAFAARADERRYVDPETGRQRIVEISKETTFITEPLDEDGYPDYSALLREYAGRDHVKLENNAAIPLIQIFGKNRKASVGRPEQVDSLLKEMGAAPLTNEEKTLTPFSRYLQEELRKDGPLRGGDEISLPRRIQAALQKPWKASDQPIADRWIKSEEAIRAIRLLDEMMSRTGYYVPSQPLVSGKGQLPRMGIQYPHLGMMYQLALLVEYQLNKDLAEQRFPEAVQGIERLHWMARITEKHLGALEFTPRIRIELAALRGEVSLAQSEGVPADIRAQQKTRLRDLSAIDIAPVIDIADRITSILVILSQARMLTSTAADTNPGIKEWVAGYEKAPYDFNIALRHINHVYDALPAIVNLPQDERTKQLKEFLSSLPADVDATIIFAGQSLNSYLENVIQGFVLDPYDRYRTTTVLTKLVLAIESYRVENGAYPESIDAIVPKYLDAIPLDAATGKPVACEFVGEGYRVEGTRQKPILEFEGRIFFESPGLGSHDAIPVKQK